MNLPMESNFVRIAFRQSERLSLLRYQAQTCPKSVGTWLPYLCLERGMTITLLRNPLYLGLFSRTGNRLEPAYSLDQCHNLDKIIFPHTFCSKPCLLLLL